MAFAEDLSPFFNSAEFAVSATLGGVAVSVLFDNGYSAGSVGGLGMASMAPTISLPTTLVPTNVVGLPVVLEGLNYLVAEHQPDTNGISALLLERTAT